MIYIPVTPAGTLCDWLECKTKQSAIDALLKDAAHMPYKTWDNFYERGYRIYSCAKCSCIMNEEDR